jgi:tRNA (guanine-N7-)-methyltransferase
MPAKSDYYPALVAERKSDLHALLSSLIPPSASLVWEIGAGHGHFLTAYAAEHPQELCIGIDLIKERVERAMRKRDRAQLAQLHFIQAEARLFLETLPPDARISRVFILFPDPWPKTRHHKNRIIQAAFLTELRRKMLPGAHLHFRTDHEPYFSEAHATIMKHPDWKVVESPWPFEHETVFQHRAESFHSLVAEVRS